MAETIQLRQKARRNVSRRSSASFRSIPSADRRYFSIICARRASR